VLLGASVARPELSREPRISTLQGSARIYLARVDRRSFETQEAAKETATNQPPAIDVSCCRVSICARTRFLYFDKRKYCPSGN
jgi:hypothetical protein